MLKLQLPEIDDIPAVELRLEHSLVSLSKWESKYEKPFYTKEEKSREELTDYVLFMILNDPVPDWALERCSQEHFDAINSYLNSKQSASWFNEPPDNKKAPEQVTSELVYYWMVQFRIPFEAQYWHFNRLMTLIKICGIKQTPPKKMSKHAQMAEYRRLNEQRRQQMGTAG